MSSNTSLTRTVDILMCSGCNDDEDNENLFTSNRKYVGNGRIIALSFVLFNCTEVTDMVCVEIQISPPQEHPLPQEVSD